ncbi:MAG: DUF899 domain-containing protein [Alphaproteobacteria bacterium]|nr:DUF899 domain-containing protein [Alphaproteobacteria bacterium]
MAKHAVVSEDQWLAARRAHLEAEKEFTRARDRLSEARRDLPHLFMLCARARSVEFGL